MSNEILRFIKNNDLSGGEALLARKMLENGIDPRSTQFTLAFGYGSNGAADSLFLESVRNKLHRYLGYLDPILQKSHPPDVIKSKSNPVKVDIDLHAEICGIKKRW